MKTAVLHKNRPSRQGYHHSKSSNNTLHRSTEKGTPFFSTEHSFFQPKLRVNPSGDIYEKEADTMADRVMSMPTPAPVMQPPGTGFLQKQNEEEEVQTRPLASLITPLIQRQEEEVQAKYNNALQLQDEEEVQAKTDGNEEWFQTKFVSSLQLQDEEEIQTLTEDEDIQEKEEDDEAAVQLWDSPVRSPAPAPVNKGSGHSFEHTLRSTRGQGSPLSDHTRNFMEVRFGADFSGVRIHDNIQAASLSRAVRARAFTTGRDIYFNKAEYMPGTRVGDRLLAHELTHTIQQGAVPVQENETVPDTQPDPQIQLQPEDDMIDIVPQLLNAVRTARGEIGKVNAKKTGPDGTRHGWQHLWEYFRTAFGSNPTVPEDAVKHVRKKEGKDAMPSWCGIFIWWAYKKSGVNVPDWRFGGGQVKELEVFPPGRVPQPGDIAYRNTNSHYAIVSDLTQAPAGAKKSDWKVTTINGNTAGSNNLGGQIEEKTESGARWDGYFNPVTGLDLPVIKVKRAEVAATGPHEVSEEPELTGEQLEASTIEKEKKQKEIIEAVSEQEMIPEVEEAGEEKIIVSDHIMEAPMEDLPESKDTGPVEPVATVVAARLSGPADKMIETTAELSPSQIAATYPGLGESVTGQLPADTGELMENVPKLEAKSGGIEGELKIENPMQPGGKADIPDGKTGGDPAVQKATPHEYKIPPPESKETKKNLKEKDEGSFWDWFKSRFRSIMSSIQTRDTGCDTTAGERPVMDLTGSADPNRAKVQSEEADARVGEEKGKLVTDLQNHPGQGRIQPVKVQEQYDVKLNSFQNGEVSSEGSSAMKDYTEMHLPEDYRNAADEKLVQGLSPKLAGTKADVSDAAAERDREKETAVNNTQAEADELNRQADSDQKKTINNNRSKIADEQARGIKEANDNMKSFRRESSDEKNRLDGDIHERVEKDQKAAADALGKAEEDARKEKEKREKEAAAKKREMEENSKDDGWWSRVKKTVKKAVKALTDAIDKIFTELRKAVKTIIDKAKNFAIDMIEKGRKWIVDKIDRFRNWLKDKVNKYLNAFPALQKAINDGIDSIADTAIEGVNFVADNLKKGIEKLANKLSAALDKLLAKFQAALKAAVQVMGAILTGDFEEALKIAFFAICELAGIDPNPILDFIDRAKEQLVRILKDPGTFIRNVGRGIQGGFKLFWKNIRKHLIDGVIGWLTGALSEVNITLPEKWDVKGIFSLVMQILGLTYRNIRAKVVKKLGPNGEKIVSTVEKTVKFVVDLVTRGPIVLWDMAKQWLSNLKEMVLSGIRNWLITKIIKEGIIWLLSLTNPASAIGKALKMIFDVVSFLIERFEQIKNFVLSVYETVSEIAKGNVNKVAVYIEGTLAKMMPVMIGFMASLIGLGGISKTVIDIIKKIREPIDKVVDIVVTKIVGFAKKIVGKVVGKAKEVKEKIMDWWKARKKFKMADGSSHTLYFTGEGNSAKLMMASTPGPLELVINQLEKDHTSAEAKAKLSSVKDQIKIINGLKADPAMGKEKGQKITDALNNIAQLLRDEAFGVTEIVPPSKITWKTTTKAGGSVGQSMTASPLSLDSGGHSGSQPLASGTSELWKKVNRRKMTYVQGHLLNHHVHGPGELKNLVPIHRTLNTKMETSVESKVKNEVLGNKKVVNFEVNAIYGANPNRDYIPEEKEMPTALSFSVEQMKKKSGRRGDKATDWEKAGKVQGIPAKLPNILPPDTPADITPVMVNLNTADLPQIATVPGIGEVLAGRIIAERNKIPTNKFVTFKQVTDKVSGLGEKKLDILRTYKWVKLG